MTLELGLYLCCHSLVLVTSYCPLFFAPKLNARCRADKPVWGVFRAALSGSAVHYQNCPSSYCGGHCHLPDWVLVPGHCFFSWTKWSVSSVILQSTESIENETWGRIQPNTLLCGRALEERGMPPKLLLGHSYLAIMPHEPLALSKSAHMCIPLKGLFENFWCLQILGHRSLNALT